MASRLVALLGVIGPALACPCPQDRDTLATERVAAPGAFEAVVGFVRPHTPEFYRHRLDQIAAEVERVGGWTPALFDDQAVALARLDRLDEALAALAAKDERFPGLWTTPANRGWILAEAGRWAEARRAFDAARPQQPDTAAAALAVALAGYQERAAAAGDGLLPVDLVATLGDRFRRDAPRGADDAAGRAAVDARLGLPEGYVEALARLIAHARRELPEPYFAMAEILATRGDRRLAWYAYQRALELEHPRRVDIPFYQAQVKEGADRRTAGELSELRWWQLRRRALDYQAAWRRRELEILAAGGDPAAEEAITQFVEEHPLP